MAGHWILLVEDDDNARRAVTWVLERSGAEVTAVPSARDALAALAAAHGRDARPNLIISDIGMAEMDGYAFLRRVREIESTRGQSPIPAIALTAYADEANRRKATDAGYQLHLPKPVEPTDLLGAILSLIK